MTLPRAVLAFLSVVGGWIGLPFQAGGHPFERWLGPVFESGAVGTMLGEGAEHAAQLPATTEWLLIGLSVGVAVLGIFLAWRAYLARPEVATSLQARFAGIHRALLNKYWVDELYDRIVVRPIVAASMRLWTFWDEKIVDGAVNGVAYVIEGLSAGLRLFQTGFVGTYALFFTIGVVALILHFLRG